MQEALSWAKLLVTLGLEVWKAVRNGETTKTVGEIFEGATKDMSEIERLELLRFGPKT